MPIRVLKAGGLVTRITFFRLESDKIPLCNEETVAEALQHVNGQGFAPAAGDLATTLVNYHTRRDLPREMPRGRLVILLEDLRFVALEPDDDQIYHGDGPFSISKFVPVFMACVKQAKKTGATSHSKAA